MGSQTLTTAELLAENIRLRQERLSFYNLISITQDQIAILQKNPNLMSSSQDERFSRRPITQYSEEYKEATNFLLEEHKEAVEIDVSLLDSESNLIVKSDDIDISDYCDALQQIVEKKIDAYTHIMLAVRAARLSKN